MPEVIESQQQAIWAEAAGPRVCDKFVGTEINLPHETPRTLPNAHSFGNISAR